MNLPDGWEKLRVKGSREEFVERQLKAGIPAQIRELLGQRGLSQQELAKRADIRQGVVSRAADPDNGNLTLNTILRIAAGFDVAFVGKFVPFSELSRWSGEAMVAVKTFEEEDREFSSVPEVRVPPAVLAIPGVRLGFGDQVAAMIVEQGIDPIESISELSDLCPEVVVNHGWPRMVSSRKRSPWLEHLLRLERMGEEDPAGAHEEMDRLTAGRLGRLPKGWKSWSVERRAEYLDEKCPLDSNVGERE